MNFDEYQDAAHETAKYGNNPMYPVLGLAEEAGEVSGKVAKFIRHHDGLDPFVARNWVTMNDVASEARDAIVKELGDVLWMVSEISGILGVRLSDVAQGNIDKLTDRKERGVIDGEGDNR